MALPSFQYLPALIGPPQPAPPAKNNVMTVPDAPHGLGGEYKSVIISTDLEPDDIFALALMAHQLQQLTPEKLFFVTGEGNRSKKNLLATILSQLEIRYKPENIVETTLTTSEYPPGMFSAYELEAPAPNLGKPPDTDLRPLFNFMESTKDEPTLVLLLKPPKEFQQIAAMKASGDATVRDKATAWLTNTSAIMYGSFNFNELEKRDEGGQKVNVYENNAEKQAEFLSMFKRSFLVTRADCVGQNATMEHRYKDLWKTLVEMGDDQASTAEAQLHLNKAVRVWSIHQLKTQKSKIGGILDRVFRQRASYMPEHYADVERNEQFQRKTIELWDSISKRWPPEDLLMLGDEEARSTVIMKLHTLKERVTSPNFKENGVFQLRGMIELYNKERLPKKLQMMMDAILSGGLETPLADQLIPAFLFGNDDLNGAYKAVAISNNTEHQNAVKVSLTTPIDETNPLGELNAVIRTLYEILEL